MNGSRSPSTALLGPTGKVGAAIGVVPAVSSGFRLTCRDHASWKGRLRTVGYGAFGGLLAAAAFTWFRSDRTAPRHELAAGALWRAGIGLVTAALGPTLHALLFSGGSGGSTSTE